jgi:hypothetical protein
MKSLSWFAELLRSLASRRAFFSHVRKEDRTGDNQLLARYMRFYELVRSTNVVYLILRERTFLHVVRDVPDLVQTLNPRNLIRFFPATPTLGEAVIVLKLIPIVLILKNFRVVR